MLKLFTVKLEVAAGSEIQAGYCSANCLGILTTEIP